jgi:hypothetical protein
VVVVVGAIVIVLVAAPVDHTYEFAPLAVNVPGGPCPLQIVAVFAETIGKELTVITPVAVFVHPNVEPVTV